MSCALEAGATPEIGEHATPANGCVTCALELGSPADVITHARQAHTPPAAPAAVR